MKKIYIANGHYYINGIHCLTINKCKINKTCLNDKKPIKDKKELCSLLSKAFKKDIDLLKGKKYFCVTHKAFIRILEEGGFETIAQPFPCFKNKNINNLYEYWKTNDCDICSNKNECIVFNNDNELTKKDECIVFLKVK